MVCQGRQKCDGTMELWVAAGENKGIFCGGRVVDTKGMYLCSAAKDVMNSHLSLTKGQVSSGIY